MFKILMAAAAVCSFSMAVQAAPAAYPDRPVKILVGYAPGATVDMVTRQLAVKLSQQTGQSFVVENKPGAGGMLAASQAAHANPDGYTLLAYDNTYVTMPNTMKDLPVDPQASFIPITIVMNTPGVVVVPSNSPYKTLESLIAFAKANPGKMNYGAGAQGGSVGLGTEAFKQAAKVDIQYVPYKGGAEAVVGLLSNQVDMALLTTPSVVTQVQSGRLRALAVTGPQRLPIFPSVPTFDEAGLPGFTFNNWTGLAAPTGTPKAVIDVLYAQVKTALQSPEMQAYIKQMNARAGGQDPDAFGKQVRDELQRWGTVAKGAGLYPR